jgi:hypothetical protein
MDMKLGSLPLFRASVRMAGVTFLVGEEHQNGTKPRFSWHFLPAAEPLAG